MGEHRPRQRKFVLRRLDQPARLLRLPVPARALVDRVREPPAEVDQIRLAVRNNRCKRFGTCNFCNYGRLSLEFEKWHETT